MLDGALFTLLIGALGLGALLMLVRHFAGGDAASIVIDLIVVILTLTAALGIAIAGMLWGEYTVGWGFITAIMVVLIGIIVRAVAPYTRFGRRRH
ncbi:MAG: hypothetical protein LAT55_13020 [Opitutales bacterium]|nr:hypothetical protein [Opitutales bacterium]